MRSTTVAATVAFSVLLGSTGSGATTGETTETESCEYTRVFIDTNAFKMDGAEERARRAVLEIAREIDFGWEIVPDRTSAYWVLTAYSVLNGDAFSIGLSLVAGIRLHNHVFIAQLQNDNFPDPGLRRNHSFVLSTKADPATLRPTIASAKAWLWDSQSAVLDRLCELGDELREEGWTGLAELRMELVEEMQRARRRREQEYQKRLEIRIE